jgi:predicted enzyme related to lactoylglutathione lyase
LDQRLFSPEGEAIESNRRLTLSSLYDISKDSPMTLNRVIKFVAYMDRAVKFHRDVLGLPLVFQSPGWSEFATGETKLALHPASERNLPGTVELGFHVTDIQKFHDEMRARGVEFSMPPTKQDFGGVLAQFVDSEGGHCSVAQAR